MDGHWQIDGGTQGVMVNHPWRGHVNIHSYQAATSMWKSNKKDTNGYHITWHAIASVFFWVAKFNIVTTPIENWKQTSILPATLPAIRSLSTFCGHWYIYHHISQVLLTLVGCGTMWFPKNHSRAVLVSRSAHSSLRTRRLRVEKCSPAVSLVTAPGSTVLSVVGNHVFFHGLSSLLSSNST